MENKLVHCMQFKEFIQSLKTRHRKEYMKHRDCFAILPSSPSQFPESRTFMKYIFHKFESQYCKDFNILTLTTLCCSSDCTTLDINIFSFYASRPLMYCYPRYDSTVSKLIYPAHVSLLHFYDPNFLNLSVSHFSNDVFI